MSEIKNGAENEINIGDVDARIKNLQLHIDVITKQLSLLKLTLKSINDELALARSEELENRRAEIRERIIASENELLSKKEQLADWQFYKKNSE